jgi:hypothetical protein
MTISWDQNAIRKLTEEAGKKATDLAERAVSGARCPEHHKAPKITGRNSRTGEFTIEACCEEGKKAAMDGISRKLH